MLDKILKITAIVALAILALSFVTTTITGNRATDTLGATWNGGVSHTNSQFDAVGGFSVNGNPFISSTSSVSIGSTGTPLAREFCGTATWNPGAVIGFKSTSTNITVTGASLGSNQVYFGGINTSTQGLLITTNATGTNSITLTLTNPSSSTIPSIATATVSACYQQF